MRSSGLRPDTVRVGSIGVAIKSRRWIARSLAAGSITMRAATGSSAGTSLIVIARAAEEPAETHEGLLFGERHLVEEVRVLAEMQHERIEQVVPTGLGRIVLHHGDGQRHSFSRATGAGTARCASSHRILRHGMQ
jgi:hypothetical protein